MWRVVCAAGRRGRDDVGVVFAGLGDQVVLEGERAERGRSRGGKEMRDAAHQR